MIAAVIFTGCSNSDNNQPVNTNTNNQDLNTEDKHGNEDNNDNSNHKFEEETKQQQKLVEENEKTQHTFEEVKNMTQEEREKLSAAEKGLYGISPEGMFYSEHTSSKEQIEGNKKVNKEASEKKHV